jgi:hypothetical protein
MSRDLSVAWELLTTIEHARQQLSAARHQIWDKARLPTAEHTSLTSVSADGGRWGQWNVGAEHILVRLSLETQLPDGRRLTSRLDVVTGPRRWLVWPYIILVGGNEERIWEGALSDREDPSGFAGYVDAATASLLAATMNVDFAALGSRA